MTTLQHDPQFVREFAHLGLIHDSLRMVYGMSAHGNTEVSHHFQHLHDIIETVRKSTREGDWGYQYSSNDGVHETFRYWINNDETVVAFGVFRPQEAQIDSSFEDACDFLAGWFGIGQSCGHMYDCCGCWFTHGLHVWPEGSGDWYFSIRYSPNI